MTAEETSSRLTDIMAKFGLNVKQARFILLIWGGFPATTSYLHAYKHGADVVVDSKPYKAAAASASRLLKNAKVSKALDALTSREDIPSALTRGEKRGIIAQVARREVPDVKPVDMMRAIREDNLMQNEHSHDGDIDDAGSGTKKLLIEMVVNAQGS